MAIERFARAVALIAIGRAKAARHDSAHPNNCGVRDVSEWVLLLPPSETKAIPPANGMAFDTALKTPKANAFKQLNTLRLQVLDGLEAVLKRQGGLEEVFEVRGEALEEVLRLNRNVRAATTLPARELYAGIMYQAIAYKSLGKVEKKRFDDNTLILSGLYGVVRPADRIAPYKLKMSCNLGGYIGKLANFWRHPISEIVRKEIKGKVVWNFLPDQHRRVWDGTGEVKANHSVKFVKRVVRSGVAEWKTISHHSKSLKGALIRHLLTKDASSPKDLMDFEHPDGYKYDPQLSVRSRREALLVFAAE